MGYKKRINFLVNSGNTHNFIRKDLVRKVGLEVDKGVVFLIMVANGIM